MVLGVVVVVVVMVVVVSSYPAEVVVVVIRLSDPTGRLKTSLSPVLGLAGE